MFDSEVQPSSDETTRGIRVRVGVKFIPAMSNSLDKFFYSYQVRISDNGVEENKHYKLKSRKWVIKRGNG